MWTLARRIEVLNEPAKPNNPAAGTDQRFVGRASTRRRGCSFWKGVAIAGDWLKWVKGFARKSEVIAIAHKLGIDRRAAATATFEVFEWADDQTTDGHVRGLPVTAIDEIVGVPGIADALCSVGWVRLKTDGFTFTNFGRHNGKTAKSRCQTAKRVAAHKQRSANAVVTPTPLPREEKRREEKDPPKPPEGGWLAAAARLYDAYPKKEAKAAGLKAAEKAIRSVATVRGLSPGESSDWLLDRVVAYAASPKVATTARGYIPLPATWFNEGRYDDPPEAWGPNLNGSAKAHATPPLRSSSGAREGVS